MKIKRHISHEDFLKKVYLSNEYYRQGIIQIVGKYTGCRNYILVEDKYGLLSVRPRYLLEGLRPTIQSAIDKTEYCIQQFKEVHGDKYDYSKVDYINARQKATIICNKHGEFIQEVYSHKKGLGCRKCKYESYAGVKSWEDKAKISKDFESFKVYVIFMQDKEFGECFYKVGVTYRQINKRLMDFNKHFITSVEAIFTFETAYEAVWLESYFLNTYRGKFSPIRLFPGSTETFPFSPLNYEFYQPEEIPEEEFIYYATLGR